MKIQRDDDPFYSAKCAAAGFFPARTVMIVLVRRSGSISIKIGVIRRLGGDKPRRYMMMPNPDDCFLI